MRQLLCLATFLALARPGLAADWAQDVTAHFVEPHTRSHVTEESTKKNTPSMVIVMTTWCGACSGLRASVNTGVKVKPLLDKFTVAYATEEGAENVWTEAGQNYVPQIYFFNPAGKQLHIHAEGNFKYYFSDEDALETAMNKALELVAAGSVGEPSEGHAAVEAPPEIPEEPAHKVVASPEPEHKEVIFDPKHSFDQSIAGHFLENLKPTDLQQKAIEANRPFMVILTQSWCKACQELINSVNGGNHTKDLLSAFVCNNAYGEDGMINWQPEGENYVPQVLFFDVDGSLLPVSSPHEGYKHFFGDDEELASGMAMALDASKAAGEL